MPFLVLLVKGQESDSGTIIDVTIGICFPTMFSLVVHPDALVDECDRGEFKLDS